MYRKQGNMVHVPEQRDFGTCTENDTKWYMYRKWTLRNETELAKNTEMVHVPVPNFVWRKTQ